MPNFWEYWEIIEIIFVVKFIREVFNTLIIDFKR